jgi:hypothetical protein
MEYDELYDESPYTSKEVPRRGGIMTTIRATFLVCATILASVFAMLFYGYQQDQFVINSNGAFVSIFDRKSRTINICDKGNCNLLTPNFESRPLIAQGFGSQGQIIPQMARGNPQMGQPPMGNPQMGNPQMMGGINPQTLAQLPMGNPQMANPQMMGGAPVQAPAATQTPAADEAPADEAATDEAAADETPAEDAEAAPAAEEPEEEAAPI